MFYVECVAEDFVSSSVDSQRGNGGQVAVWSRLASVLFRTLPKLSAEVGKRLFQGAMRRSSRGMMRGLVGGTKPVYVDPGFATDRDRFRLE